MGRFFTSVQIRSNNSKEQFIKSFSNMMKKRGFVPCSEDEAVSSYILAFSESGKWVTLTCEDYSNNPKQAHDDAKQTAAEMKTSSFSMDVVDSDWTYIELYTGTDIHDTVIVGRSEFPDDDSPKGRRECWEQLLVSGKTWEQISEIWNKNEVFVEDALYEAASVLGIEPKYMVSDYEDFESKADKDTNIIPMFFKKKNERTLSLNAAFKQVFGEALEPLGFVKIKVAKLTYFVRVVNDEILHILTYRELRTRKTGYKSFEILGGVVSLYRRTIDFTKSPECWLKNNHHYYCSLNPEIDDDVMESAVQYVCDVWGKSMDWFVRTESLEGAFSKSIVHFLYKSDDIYGMKNAFNVTQNVMLPIFDEAINLNNCIEHFYKLGTPMDICCDLEEFNTKPHYYYSEGLLLIKTGYKGDITPYMENILAMKVKEVEKGLSGLSGATDINDYKNRFRQKVQQQIIIRDQMLNDAKLNTKVTAELKKRRTDNIRTLKSFGLEI